MTTQEILDEMKREERIQSGRMSKVRRLMESRAYRKSHADERCLLVTRMAWFDVEMSRHKYFTVVDKLGDMLEMLRVNEDIVDGVEVDDADIETLALLHAELKSLDYRFLQARNIAHRMRRKYEPDDSSYRGSPS